MNASRGHRFIIAHNKPESEDMRLGEEVDGMLRLDQHLLLGSSLASESGNIGGKGQTGLNRDCWPTSLQVASVKPSHVNDAWKM